jgi:hypothetical protein
MKMNVSIDIYINEFKTDDTDVMGLIDMIHDEEALTNKYISVPTDLGQFDCGAYIAGIIRGILYSSGFVSFLLKLI